MVRISMYAHSTCHPVHIPHVILCRLMSDACSRDRQSERERHCGVCVTVSVTKYTTWPCAAQQTPLLLQPTASGNVLSLQKEITRIGRASEGKVFEKG